MEPEKPLVSIEENRLPMGPGRSRVDVSLKRSGFMRGGHL